VWPLHLLRELLLVGLVRGIDGDATRIEIKLVKLSKICFRSIGEDKSAFSMSFDIFNMNFL